MSRQGTRTARRSLRSASVSNSTSPGPGTWERARPITPMTDTAAVATAHDAPTVTLVSGPAFELVAELAAFASGPARASLESGKTWIRDVRRLAGPDLLRRVERWAFPLYTELVPITLDAGPPFE